MERHVLRGCLLERCGTSRTAGTCDADVLRVTRVRRSVVENSLEIVIQFIWCICRPFRSGSSVIPKPERGRENLASDRCSCSAADEHSIQEGRRECVARGTHFVSESS